jgi:hypothetical protein
MSQVIMWEQPLKTACFVAAYALACVRGLLGALSTLALAVTMAYYGVTQPRVLQSLGLEILTRDMRREPLFANASRTKRLRERTRSSVLSQLADPDRSPLHASNLPKLLIGSIAEKLSASGSGGEHPGIDAQWAAVRDCVLPAAQVAVRDLADLFEKVRTRCACACLCLRRRPRGGPGGKVQSNCIW